ncbi:hypothetical protein [Rhodovulum sp. MB263]|uniref:hypothetical protein n=1 Tax=Rhodovulum sp. (strain MB263) TaxID=308754 RepID=UPI0009B72CE9|nr:hypothetical protein [Rhodovulum sp. MB263]ARC89985.1 hypothetical protein B5V46_15920 [Rhodovulum sp. MB263]ARC90379.1 hypothetical protein B5V46_18130 [Rhodovulum sp. MB263]
MGKGSKTRARAVKLAKKAELAGVPGLAPVTRRRADGRKASSNYDQTAADLALKTRCRQMGWKPNAANMRKARGPSLECEAGRVLHMLCTPDEAERLWSVFGGLCRAQAVYMRRYLGARRHAKTARLETMCERFEVTGDEDLDTRTEDEKADAAVNNWMAWQGCIGNLESAQQRAIWGALWEDFVLFDTAPTVAGRAYAQALRELADVVERRQ